MAGELRRIVEAEIDQIMGEPVLSARRKDRSDPLIENTGRGDASLVTKITRRVPRVGVLVCVGSE